MIIKIIGPVIGIMLLAFGLYYLIIKAVLKVNR